LGDPFHRTADFVQVFHQVIPVQNLSTFGDGPHQSHQIPDPVMPIAQAGGLGSFLAIFR
jgi:hypothetical protein